MSTFAKIAPPRGRTAGGFAAGETSLRFSFGLQIFGCAYQEDSGRISRCLFQAPVFSIIYLPSYSWSRLAL